MASATSMTAQTRSSGDALPPLHVILGKSAHMRAVGQQLEKIAAANVPVLVHGESGTGKDVIARLIHKLSPWASGPFVKINCPAIPSGLIESELFGYERGAFTGAINSKPGRVEMANRGTLFMDEISELDLGLQAKLLQLLQDSQFCRIGANEDKRVEARVVCATNQDLEEEVKCGSFRADLFYRINVLNIRLCPLRQRADDIPELVSYFIDVYNEKYNLRARPVSADAMRRLRNYSWPGNIRDLENVIKRYVIFGTESVFEEFPSEQKSSALNTRGDFEIPPEVIEGVPLSLKTLTKQLVLEVERQIILKSLQTHNWNRKRTAKALKISYRALLYKIRDSGLPSRRMSSTIAPEVGPEDFSDGQDLDGSEAVTSSTN